MEFDQMDYQSEPDFGFAQDAGTQDEQLGFEGYENAGDDQLGFEGGYEQQQEEFVYDQDQGESSFGFAFDDNQAAVDSGLQQPDVALPTPTATTGESAKDRWSKQKAVELQQLAATHRQEKDKAIAAGQRELELFYKNRQTTIAQSKANNRTEESQGKADLANTLSNGTEWQKVAKYCDLKERHDPKAANQTVKTERMRTLLVDLRNEKR